MTGIENDHCSATIQNENGEIELICLHSEGGQCLKLQVENGIIKKGNQSHFVGPCADDESVVTRSEKL